MADIAVIQCASCKQEKLLRLPSGERIEFVAVPDGPCPDGRRYCRPDDEIGPGQGTWRAYVEEYNKRHEFADQGKTQDELVPAAELYKPQRPYHDLYERLADKCDCFILSAGWGLIRSTFLTPYYNITFGPPQRRPKQEQDVPEWCRHWKRIRRKFRVHTFFKDFNHLKERVVSPTEQLHFFGGDAYRELFCLLTDGMPAKKILYYYCPRTNKNERTRSLCQLVDNTTYRRLVNPCLFRCVPHVTNDKRKWYYERAKEEFLGNTRGSDAEKGTS